MKLGGSLGSGNMELMPEVFLGLGVGGCCGVSLTFCGEFVGSGVVGLFWGVGGFFMGRCRFFFSSFAAVDLSSSFCANV